MVTVPACSGTSLCPFPASLSSSLCPFPACVGSSLAFVAGPDCAPLPLATFPPHSFARRLLAVSLSVVLFAYFRLISSCSALHDPRFILLAVRQPASLRRVVLFFPFPRHVRRVFSVLYRCRLLLYFRPSSLSSPLLLLVRGYPLTADARTFLRHRATKGFTVSPLSQALITHKLIYPLIRRPGEWTNLDARITGKRFSLSFSCSSGTHKSIPWEFRNRRIRIPR